MHEHKKSKFRSFTLAVIRDMHHWANLLLKDLNIIDYSF